MWGRLKNTEGEGKFWYHNGLVLLVYRQRGEPVVGGAKEEGGKHLVGGEKIWPSTARMGKESVQRGGNI